MTPTREDFEQHLADLLRMAATGGATMIELRAGDVHRALGSYPGPDHRMPLCCAVMRAVMQDGDLIVAQPPKGAGANLVIRYQFPRSP